MAGINTTTVVIDGTKYEIAMLGAKQGRRVLARLAQLAAPALGGLSKVDAAGLGASEGVAALSKVVEGLSPDVVDELCDIFVGTTRVETAPNTMPQLDAVFDSHFAGKYLAMTKWLVACLRHNFPDFLGDKLLTGLAAGLVASRSTSPTP